MGPVVLFVESSSIKNKPPVSPLPEAEVAQGVVSVSPSADCQSNPLHSPRFRGTRKSVTLDEVREYLIKAFRDCKHIPFQSGTVSIRRRFARRKGRKVWYHTILGEKVNLLAMRRHNSLLPNACAGILVSNLPDCPPTFSLDFEILLVGIIEVLGIIL